MKMDKKIAIPGKRKKVSILSNSEKGIFEKFKNGGKIESDEDWDVLEKYASLGFVSFGFLSKKAKLTEEGIFVLDHS